MIQPFPPGADPFRVSVNEMALVQGLADTRSTLAEWNRRPLPVLREWLVASVAIAVALLGSVYLVARLSTPDPTPLQLPGVNADATLADVGRLLFRNSLVLALHAMACVAGFIAGSSLPMEAARRGGLARIVHQRAGPLAIGFVVCATTFSLVTQAYALGHSAATVAAHLRMGIGTLLVGLLPHALPELTALFLPLAAWVIASRRAEWSKLLAATFVTVALAAPALVISSLVEVYASPHLIKALM
ncbi:MAG: hypothetical protein NVSMB25_04900 [Thermoleophilaceae bacterium]